MELKKPIQELKIVKTKSKTREELESELHKEGFSSYVWSDSPGAYYSPHSHNHDECICVIKGQISFYINNKEYELSPGQKLYLPAHTIHEARNKKNESVTYLIGETN